MPMLHKLRQKEIAFAPVVSNDRRGPAEPVAACAVARPPVSGCASGHHEHDLHAGARERVTAHPELCIDHRRPGFEVDPDAITVTTLMKAVSSALQGCAVTVDSLAPVAQPFAGAHHV